MVLAVPLVRLRSSLGLGFAADTIYVAIATVGAAGCASDGCASVGSLLVQFLEFGGAPRGILAAGGFVGDLGPPTAGFGQLTAFTG